MSKAQICGLDDVQPGPSGKYNLAQTNLIVGLLLKMQDTQATAATSTATFVALQECQSPQAWFMANEAAAAGESFSTDIKKVVSGAAAATILTTPLVYDSTAATSPVNTLIPFVFDATKLPILQGTVIQVIRTYVAGGGPAAPATTVIMLPRPHMAVPNGEFSTGSV